MKLTCKVISFTIIMLLACQPLSIAHQDYSDKAELQQLEHIAKKVLNLKFDKIERIGSEYNFMALKSMNILFTKRLDSRTYLVQDIRYGEGRNAGIFEGSEEELTQACRDIFNKLDIPISEIEKEVVQQEYTQIASIDSAKGNVKHEKEKKGQKLAKFTRQIEAIPVFSSSVTLGLTKNKEIGFMEFHWPEIPKHVVTEAHRLKYKVQKGWQPPEQKGAKVETVEAGILHSSTVGFLMDIYPVIRVIYSSEDKKTGRKLVLYLDRHGNTVPFPREFEIECPEPKEQREMPKERKH